MEYQKIIEWVSDRGKEISNNTNEEEFFLLLHNDSINSNLNIVNLVTEYALVFLHIWAKYHEKYQNYFACFVYERLRKLYYVKFKVYFKYF